MFTYFDHTCFSFSSCHIWPQFSFSTRTSDFPPCPKQSISTSSSPWHVATYTRVKTMPSWFWTSCVDSSVVLIGQRQQITFEFVQLFINYFLMLRSLSSPQHRYCFSQILYKFHDLEISKYLLSLANWNQTVIWKKVVEKLTDRQLNSQSPGDVRWFSLSALKHRFILCVRWEDAGYGSTPAKPNRVILLITICSCYGLVPGLKVRWLKRADPTGM